MNERLEQAWRDGLPPFDGITVWAGDLSLEQIQIVGLIAIADFGRRKGDDGGRSLFSLVDWHEHDGWPTDAKPMDLARLQQAFETAEGIERLCTDDCDVCAAIYTDAFDCLWRFGIDYWPTSKATDGLRRWRFDCSGNRQLVERVIRELAPFGIAPLDQMPTKQFFDERYEG